MKNTHKQSGFTLIEILIVVAVIGMLSSVVMTAVNQARVKARDTKRKGDLVQLAKALESYYTSNNGYPCTGTNGSCTVAVSWTAATGNCGAANASPAAPPYTYSGPIGYIPNLAPTYVGALPSDPKPSTNLCSGYMYRSDGSNFKLVSNNVSGVGGPETLPAAGQPFYDSFRSGSGIMITNNPSATSGW